METRSRLLRRAGPRTTLTLDADVEQVINDALRRGLTSGGHAWPARYRVDFGRFPQLRWVNPIAR